MVFISSLDPSPRFGFSAAGVENDPVIILKKVCCSGIKFGC
jgi:hypothetical protein